MSWVSRITTIGLEMVLPAIGGNWLDKRLGVSWITPVGLTLGLLIGGFHLIQLARTSTPADTSNSTHESPPDDQNLKR